MKYTARHVQRFIHQGKIDPDLWKERFPSVLETKVPACGDCEEYKRTLCEGDKNPVECLLSATEEDREKGSSASEKPSKKRSEANEWKRRAKGKEIPPGANRSFDQSRI